jgi:hypothetical protein
MTVRLVADIQNRLFWRVGTSRASECCVPSAGWARHPEMGSEVPAEQRQQGFEPLRCCGQGVLIAATSPSQQTEGADVWFEPTSGQPTVLQTGGHNVLICGNSNRNPDLGTYRAGSPPMHRTVGARSRRDGVRYRPRDHSRRCRRSVRSSHSLTISLGIGQIAADKDAEQPTSETVSSRECPLMTLANCTLIARRSSANQDS